MSAPNISTDYYEVLEVSPSASPEVIEAAYKGLMRKYGDDPDPAIRERRQIVEAAFAVLGNAGRRGGDGDARNGLEPGPPPGTPPRHPEVQTALRCSRCETPICPRCLVQTPVGARCKDCARIGKNPIYTLSAGNAAKAAAASIVGGVVMGVIWGLVLLPFSFGFLSIFVGAGLGWAFTRLLEVVTRRKRGPYMVAFAMMGIGIAWVMQPLFFVPLGVALYGLVAAGVACYFAYQSLR